MYLEDVFAFSHLLKSDVLFRLRILLLELGARLSCVGYVFGMDIFESLFSEGIRSDQTIPPRKDNWTKCQCSICLGSLYLMVWGILNLPIGQKGSVR